MKLKFDLSFIPQWRSIELLRTGLDTILESVIENADHRAIIAMVSAELMENAYKHGERGASAIEYHLEIANGSGNITVSNHCPPDKASNMDDLESTIEWIESFENPMDAYIEKMKSLYEVEEVDSSGLGLVRIVYEGQSKLLAKVVRDKGDVTVTASFSNLSG